jgi:hypothetical protein
MHCSYFLWRFGQTHPIWLWVESLGGLIVLGFWLWYVFVEKNFSSHFDTGTIALIDLLLGIPIIVAMGLVFAIIWKGLIRGFLCIMGQLVKPNDLE